jgi:hypothetical protein
MYNACEIRLDLIFGTFEGRKERTNGESGRRCEDNTEMDLEKY